MDEPSGYCEEELGENMVRELRQTFKDEAYELLAELESSLLALEKVPDDLELINGVFRIMHTIKGSGSTCELTKIVAFTHELENFFDHVRNGEIRITKELIDLTLRARDQIKALFDAEYFNGTTDEMKTQEILASFRKRCCPGRDSADDKAWVLTDEKRRGDFLPDSGYRSSQNSESTRADPQGARGLRTKDLKLKESASIRVATEKLDRMVNLVGELVTVQARLSQTALLHQTPNLLSIAEEVERLTGNLRDTTMNMRMLPIGTMFNRFNRLVRGLSAELGKEVILTTNGAETELDKTIIERLSEPLVHLIRNSIDHGIEPPEARAAAGKPAQGMICLSAKHSGASVLIEVSDDGAGLDREAIRATALERGLVQEDADLSDREIFSLIFEPGFSTANTVTSVSGRGVGLDVVKKTIDGLRSSLDIYSQQGIGTTITLTLPLTLAIIDGLLVQIQEQHYVLPLSSVKECVELTRDNKQNANNRNIANIRGEIVPYISLREQFQIGGEPPAIEQIVIAEMDGCVVGFVVDRVIGSHQTVIKNLGTYYQAVEGISGATILGDGTVALILDMPKLLKIAEREERSTSCNSFRNDFTQRETPSSYQP